MQVDTVHALLYSYLDWLGLEYNYFGCLMRKCIWFVELLLNRAVVLFLPTL